MVIWQSLCFGKEPGSDDSKIDLNLRVQPQDKDNFFIKGKCLIFSAINSPTEWCLEAKIIMLAPV